MTNYILRYELLFTLIYTRWSVNAGLTNFQWHNFASVRYCWTKTVVNVAEIMLRKIYQNDC